MRAIDTRLKKLEAKQADQPNGLYIIVFDDDDIPPGALVVDIGDERKDQPQCMP